MKIYPNPSRSTSYISIPKDLVKECNLIVTNKQGKKVHEQKYTDVRTSLIALDLSEHPAGLYNVCIGNDNPSIFSRFQQEDVIAGLLKERPEFLFT